MALTADFSAARLIPEDSGRTQSKDKKKNNWQGIVHSESRQKSKSSGKVREFISTIFSELTRKDCAFEGNQD